MANSNDLVVLGLDIAQSKARMEAQLTQVIQSVSKGKTLDLNLNINTAGVTSAVQKQANEWQRIFKDSVKDLTAPNVDIKPLNNYYRELEKQSKAFSQKNLNGIDFEIQKREQASQRSSALIKAQMLETVKAEQQIAAAQKQTLINDTLATNVKKAQTELLSLKSTYSSIGKDRNLQEQWQQLFDQSKIVGSKEELTNLNAKMRSFKTDLQTSGQASNTFFKGFVLHLPDMLKMLVIMKAVQEVTKSFKDGIQFVKDVDNALTTINMTMDVSKAQLGELADKSIDMANKLGASTSQVLKAVQIYANMNETIEGMLEKSKWTVMLSNASGMDTSTTADMIQGVLYQFNMAQGEAQRVTDVIEKLSANIAVDYQKGINTISEAIQTSGSIAEEAGLSYEKFASIVAATAETTRQSGGTIGNAYKMIFSRISRSNTDDASQEDISKAEKAFKSVGVRIRNDNGEFRDLGDTLDDLSKVWGSLNNVQRSYVAEQAAGVRQKNIFIATMNSYNKSLQLEKEALNSNGFATETNDKYMKSIEAHSNELKNTYSEFWKNFINSDVIIFLTDVATDIGKVLNGITKTIGAVPVLTAGIAGAIVAYKKIKSAMLGEEINSSLGELNVPSYLKAA